jgi:hypothetical protein
MPAAPGEKLTKEVKIINQGEDTLNLRTYVMDYTISENNEFTFYPPGYQSYSCAKWISLDKADFSIPKDGEKTVQVTLDVPQDVEPSGHYAVIFFESIGEELEEGKSGVVAQGRIGTLVLQSTPGEEIIEGKIKKLEIPRHFFSSPKFLFYGGSLSVPWRMVFENSGNVHLNLETTLDFVNWQGKTIHSTEPARITSLPDTDREIKGTWDTAPTFGKFKAICKVTYGDGKLATSTLTFYVIPVKALVAGVVILLILIIIIFLVRRYIKKLKAATAELRYNVGLAKIKDKKYEQAIDELKQAIKLKPNYLEAYKALYKIYQQKGMAEEAQKLAKKINKLTKG